MSNKKRLKKIEKDLQCVKQMLLDIKNTSKVHNIQNDSFNKVFIFDSNYNDTPVYTGTITS